MGVCGLNSQGCPGHEMGRQSNAHRIWRFMGKRDLPEGPMKTFKTLCHTGTASHQKYKNGALELFLQLGAFAEMLSCVAWGLDMNAETKTDGGQKR